VSIALIARVVSRFLEAESHRIKVRNKDTGNIQWKTPEGLKNNPERYEKLPQEYDRNPKGRPHRPADPGDDRLPEPPKIPIPPKIKKPKKPKKPPVPVPPIKIPEPPKPAQQQPVPGEKWERHSG
jgi:hypothetical protein